MIPKSSRNTSVVLWWGGLILPATGICMFGGTTAHAEPQEQLVYCGSCHQAQAAQWEQSVHHLAVHCQQCHGGRIEYSLPVDEVASYVTVLAGQAAPTTSGVFDHGPSFRGRVRRADVPVACGTCHADVALMNPYGLRTDQLAAYWVSGHGKHLKSTGDDHVAVCIDCHGTHDILRHDSPESRTYFQKLPSTCAKCHADASLMAKYGLPATIVGQYEKSIHGRKVLEDGDSGAPNCATCHGSHGAAPPGFAEVNHVCGKCHQQIEEYFLSGVHGRLPDQVRCNECHGGGGDRRNHQIEEVTPDADALVEVYARLRDESEIDESSLEQGFAEQVATLTPGPKLDATCRYCHGAERKGPHGEFFGESDRFALARGKEWAGMLSKSQFDYARTADRVDRVGRGILLVKEEALQAADAKTELMGMYAFQHTLDATKVKERAAKLEKICDEVNASLDNKLTHLGWRRVALLPIWGFALVFMVFMYAKYLQLKRVYVRHGPEEPSGSENAVADPIGRRLFNAALSAMGLVTLGGLSWPAIAYILPARKRGGGAERVVAGKEDEWGPWSGKKVSVHGKAVIVTRTDKGFRAFSAVCTHLGCIVHWDSTGRKFHCPCHAAVFGAAGEVIAGPPPKPLPEYEVVVVQGEVIVKGAVRV